MRLTPSWLRTASVDVTTAALAAGTVAKLIAVDPPASDTTVARVGSVVVVTDRVP